MVVDLSREGHDATPTSIEPDLAELRAQCDAADLAVEIAGPGEDPHAKLGFYAAVNTRELLVVHRQPWVLELFTLAGGVLMLAGRSDADAPALLASAATGVTFRLVPGATRPEIEVGHPPGRQSWRA